MAQTISWKHVSDDVIVISKNGSHMAVDAKGVADLTAVLADINNGTRKYYKEDNR